MSLNGNNVIGSSGHRTNQPPYEIDQSLRVEDGDSAYLGWTSSATPTDSTKATFSCWFKLGSGAEFSTDMTTWTYRTIVGWGHSTDGRTSIGLHDQSVNGGLPCIAIKSTDSGGSMYFNYLSNAVIRDFSSWYHLVVVWDGSIGTAVNRIKAYLNGTELTWSTSSNSQSDFYISGRGMPVATVGANYGGSYQGHWDGYIAETHWIDGQALTPASFGETNSATNQWVPIEYDGSYGTNGFYLKFGGKGFLTYDRESEIAVTSNQDWTNSAGAATSVVLDDLVNGVESNDDAGGGWANSAWAASGSYIRFDFGSAKTYKNAQWRYRNSSGTEGTWKWQGSNNASDWTDIGSSFTLSPGSSGVDGVNRSQEFTSQLGSNTTAYRYYQILGISGNVNTSGRRIAMYFSETAYGLGGDSSGQGNNFTATNLSWSDQVLDSPPTNNFATLNPLDPSSNQTLSEGNLKQVTSGQGISKGTMQIPSSGKWYWEVCQTDTDQLVIGFAKPTATLSNYLGSDANGWGYGGYSGVIYNNGGSSAYGNTYTNGDIVGVAFDADNQAVYFSKNNTWQNSGDPTSGSSKTGAAVTSLTDEYSPASGSQNSSGVYNFGQDSSFAGSKTAQGNTDGNGKGDFYYTPPSGFLALCSDNLPDSSIADPTAHFNTVAYSGNGSTQSITTGLQPDFTWIKGRSYASNHRLIDSVRGAGERLSSNLTNAETTESNGLTSFNSDGFSVGTEGGYNNSGQTFVSWNWKAGGTAVSNTDGTITSSVSANTDAGFSIISYTGDDTQNSTIGHGLSQAPELAIFKARGSSSNEWTVWMGHITGTYNEYLYLNTTAAINSSAYYFGTSGPMATASTLKLGESGRVNNSASPGMICYAFHSVDGYSKVGSYTGNNNADGVFVYTGFRPAWVMCKRVDASGQDWRIVDNKRDTYNAVQKHIRANMSEAETTSGDVFGDLLSNGFKIRTTSGGWNDSGTYLYLAFAESPFKTSNAR